MKKHKLDLYLVSNLDFKNAVKVDEKDEVEIIPSKEKIDRNTEYTIKVRKK